MITVRKLEPEEFPKWDALVKESPSGTVYHDSRWLAPVCEAVGDTLSIYGFFESGALVAGIPAQVRKRGPFSLSQRAYATPYAGLVVQNEMGPNLQTAIKRALDDYSRHFSCATLTFSPFFREQELIPSWPRRQQATYLLKIRSLVGFWRSLASEVRNRIRKAQNQGITVSQDFEPRQFFQLFHLLFKRQGRIVPFQETRFTKLLQTLENAGLARKYLARSQDGTPCAACLVVYDRWRAYYSLAASDAELRKTGAPSLLVWEALQDINNCVQEFDFGGANIPRIAQFKSKFRGQLVSYPEVVTYRSRTERLVLDAYRRFRSGNRAESESHA